MKEWKLIEGNEVEYDNSDTGLLLMILFENNDICKYEDDWPFELATHFFVLPKLP